MRRMLIALVLLAGCAAPTSRAAPPTSSTPSPGATMLTPVANAVEPTVMAVHPGDRAIYIGERAGVVRRLDSGRLGEPVVDLRSQVFAGGERGLLGMTFAPDGTWLYVHYSNPDGDTRVDAIPFADGRANVAGRRGILAQAQPFANHNGGELTFGPDGFLYLGLGDGGSQGDPSNNGQRLDTFLGKILRIDPTPDAATPYRVPPDNPFVGTPGARPEIWTYGLRNPWRFSFDRGSGDLWIGDVGASAWEEIDWRAAADASGTNFGWHAYEGTHRARSASVPNAVNPVYEYAHGDAGCSVTGGYVYRGTRIPSLQGRYVFSDYCSGKVQALDRTGDRAQLVPGFDLAGADVVSFGEDADGELYVLSLDGAISRIDPA